MTDIEFLKWLGTTILFIGTIINSLNIYPSGQIILFFGGIIWCFAGVVSNDVPLIITNLSMTLVGGTVMCYKLFYKK